MNRWQMAFGILGMVAVALLMLFPPQIISEGTVEFRIFTENYPIDWLRLFLWIVGALLITVLGIGLNKDEHT